MKSNVLPRLIGKCCPYNLGKHPIILDKMVCRKKVGNMSVLMTLGPLIPSKKYAPSQIYLSLSWWFCRHYWSTFCVLLYVSNTFGAISNIFQAHSRNLPNDVLEKTWNHLLEWVPHLMTVVEFPVWPVELMKCLLMDWIYTTIAAIMPYACWFILLMVQNSPTITWDVKTL